MDNVKEVYGIKFPLPVRMRERTRNNQYSQIKKELCNIIKEMDKATICSIKVQDLSAAAQEILSNLGYQITINTDQHGYILSYIISWDNSMEGGQQ